MISWSKLGTDLTPVESRGGRWYKRDDYAAPLGYGGINGSKLRQLVHLVTTYAGDAPGILTGASVRSPQVSMAALVAREHRMECVVVLGATRGASALKHENVAIAHRAGAEFIFNPVAYNPALQRAVAELAKRPEFAGWYRLHYGITTPDTASPEEVEAFHAVGAAQVANVPGTTVRTLVMTAGSCNSCVSVLYGIHRHRPPALERVVLIGVGPNREQWTADRLGAIEKATGETLDLPRIERHDLHTTKFATYQDRMPFTLDGITFHPTYEGKALTYMQLRRDTFDWWWEPDGTALFWIVGSEPTAAAMAEL
jgi:1-aminocyclopropane-1-carboxylate deaminase/D-cysteine desulfhydrase-like pyridoxal-dependent ACC family enzyme